MRNPKIKTFYTDRQVCSDNIAETSSSKSPLKPLLLMKRLKQNGYIKMLEIEEKFEPISKKDFLIAHTKEYVDNVYHKKGNYASNMLPWSQNLVNSLPYTTGSLYQAKKYAILNPETVCFAPVSGMHHAEPDRGMGFCTFSGQVISAVKIYQELGKVCAYFDLDGHYGNSIEDTRKFNPLVDEAIPEGCNVNPDGYNDVYIEDFEKGLAYVKEMILNDKVHYVVFAHGADSHKEDDLGNQCDTEHWVRCAEMFATWVNEVSELLGKPLPVVLALFGGYRRDDYNAVLDLHTKSLIACSNILCGNNFEDNFIIPPRRRRVD
jgi:acetoin utilization deacetylase AcuC-like enzyme